MSATDPVPWAKFSHDPRRPETAALRASDRDRVLVLELLTEGYADGRLDKAEYDARAEAASAAKTLGDLPPIVADLVPAFPPPAGNEIATATPGELQSLAVAAFQASLRRAISGTVITTVVTVVIWLVTGAGFFWPVFVLLGTGIHVLRLLLQRRDFIDEQRRRLERKQRKALEAPRRDEAS